MYYHCSLRSADGAVLKVMEGEIDNMVPDHDEGMKALLEMLKTV